MKTSKIIYWVTTILTVGMSIMSGSMMLFNPEMAEGFKHLGYPEYFRVQLGIFKLIGAVLLIAPKLPLKIRLIGYIGFGITFVSAFIAHTTVDGIQTAIAPVISLILLVVSYIYLEKISQ